jgi:hypothetical protein
MDSAWQASQAFADRVLQSAQADPRFAARTQSAYAVWTTDPAWASLHTAGVIALGLHCLLLDRRAEGTGLDQALRETTPDQIDRALTTRPVHELFAGLPDEAMAQTPVALLKLLAYREHGPTKLTWLRLVAQARETVRHCA